ncbi:MAG: hypothetical protein ACI4HL_00570, partial [Ruminococcus sp.]
MRKCSVKIFLVLLTLCMMICSVPTAYGKESTKDNAIYFNVPVTGDYAWGNYDVVYCHIWEDGGDEFFSWQTTKEKCTRVKGNLWKYDLDILDDSRRIAGGISDGVKYAVIFSDNLGDQTYDLYFTSECIGDTVECGEETRDNPIDAQKKCLVANWVNNKYDPVEYQESSSDPQEAIIVTHPAEENSGDTLSQDMSITIIIILSAVILLLLVLLI